jgi:SdpC family antimicrobial peptide
MEARRSTVRPALARALGAAVVAAALTAACSDAGDTPLQAPSAPEETRFTGEEVFRGLVFAEGPVAQRVPELTAPIRAEQPDWDEEQRAVVAGWRRELVGDMRALDASFFDRFGEAMQSGEHLRIAAALDESRDLYRRVVDRRGAGASGGGADAGDGEIDAGNGTGACITLAVAANVAAVVNVAAAWNIAYYQNAVYDEHWFWPAVRTVNAALAREQAVQLIADRL